MVLVGGRPMEFSYDLLGFYLAWNREEKPLDDAITPISDYRLIDERRSKTISAGNTGKV